MSETIKAILKDESNYLTFRSHETDVFGDKILMQWQHITARQFVTSACIQRPVKTANYTDRQNISKTSTKAHCLEI